ncbi:BatD family protein, partial [Bacteroidales bacterium OttesenSCG-928-K03]|nr:BatD family protein [Bacteroidales bacterium OttesenSCG-928-K03]
MRLKRLIIFIAFFVPQVILCQEVAFEANGPKAVRLGEQFAITYTINQRVSKGLTFPEIPSGLARLSGPHSSSSSSFQIINGKQSHSYTTTYTFYIQATEVGKHVIKPATVTLNNKSYESNSLEIEVVQSQQGGNNQQQSQSNKPQSGSANQSSGSNTFVTSNLNKKDVYVGEQVVLSYQLYTKVDVQGFGDVKFPPYSGFWKEDYQLGNISLQPTVLNNQSYNSAEIQRNILLPQRVGEITIPSADIEIITRVRTRNSGYNDPFFNEFFGGYQSVPVVCTTKPLTLNVKSLPNEGKPASFSGAVGNFSIASSVDKTELKANEAITFKFTINGTGNIKLIDKINVKFPADFEAYAPKVTQNIKVDRNSVSGTKIFEYVVIPRNPGTFKIKSFEFSYFDPNKKEYVILNSPEFTIEVDNSDIETFRSNGVAREDVIAIGEDIKHIKTLSNELSLKSGKLFFGSTMYFIFLIGMLILFTALGFILKNFINKRNDVDNLKRKRADSVAMKRLKKAKQYMDEHAETEFYNEISVAMWQYIADRFNVPNSDLNRDFLLNLPQEYNISQEVVDKY